MINCICTLFGCENSIILSDSNSKNNECLYLDLSTTVSFDDRRQCIDNPKVTASIRMKA